MAVGWTMIGVVTTSFPRCDGDYAGSFVLEYVEALRRAGHKVEVVAPALPESVNGDWASTQSLSYLPAGGGHLNPFYRSGVPDNLRRRPYSAIGLVCFGRALKRDLITRRWDAQINHWVFPYGLFRAPGTRQLGVFHSADLFALRRVPGRGRLAEQIAQRMDGLHFVNDQQRQRFESLLPAGSRCALRARASVGPMPVEPPALHCDRDALRSQLNLHARTALVLGRLVPIKALDRAIALAEAEPSLQLVVAGSGPERRALMRLAAPLARRVRFVGELTTAQKWLWLYASDVLLVPSKTTPLGRREGMPTVISEARAVGCPVVTTVESASEAFANDPGVQVVTFPTHAALLRAVDRVVTSPRTKFRLRTMNDLVAQHSQLLGLV